MIKGSSKTRQRGIINRVTSISAQRSALGCLLLASNQADDVAKAKGLQFLAWTFLLLSRWTKVKGLYIITRYIPFLVLIMDIYQFFAPNETTNRCRMVINIFALFFVLRTYALWNNNRILLAAMLSALFSQSAQSQESPAIKIHKNWQVVNAPLYDVLVKHSLFYYTCGLLLSAANVLMQTLFSQSSLQYFLLAILATRMHRNLWQINRQARDSVTNAYLMS
ncbi:hypothetical protein EDD22DRAFT_853156 [Suillus occidentalis]|nr:hypothetical protein EDD22DRAFT_853156 [Suillus occidentalis]